MDHESTHQHPSYFSGCMSSPLWILSHNDGFRFELLSSSSSPKSRRWRNLFRRIVREGKNLYRPKPPLTFRYDVESYSQNFDDGRINEELDRCSNVFKDLRSDATQISEKLYMASDQFIVFGLYIGKEK